MVDAPAEARLRVEAGPGTGKTATACARIAALLSRGVSPGRVLLLSFTRTAVAELRERIASYLAEPELAWSVRIATVDSEAWRLCYGFTEEQSRSLLGGFEQNIARAKDLLGRDDDLVREHLASYHHILIDEAQDLLGTRAELVLTLLKRLERSCGVTVFGDPAQSIFGFSSDDEDAADADARSLLDRLPEVAGPEFERMKLTEVHRATSAGLRRLFVETRRAVLTSSGDLETWTKVREDVKSRADGEVQELVKEPIDGRPSVLALYRRRAEVLRASTELASEGLVHRLRLSQTQTVIRPWIGWLLGEWTEPRLRPEEFERLWSSRFVSALMKLDGARDAWSLLCQLARERRGTVNIKELRAVLSRPQPPLEVCVADGAERGPTLGTIHASKGREADDVLLYLPERPADHSAPLDEETRVLYVGATRARSRLLVGTARYEHGGGYLQKSGRFFRKTKTKSEARLLQVELGRIGDVEGASPLNADVVPPASYSASQRRLAQLADRIEPLRVRRCQKAEWRYVLSWAKDEAQLPLAALSQGVVQDMKAILHRLDGAYARKPAPDIGNLWMQGCTTVALPEGAAELEGVEEDARRSGFLLVPVLRGLGWLNCLPGSKENKS